MPETTQSTGTGHIGGNGADHRGLGDRVDQIGQNAQQLWSEAQGAVNQIKETLDIQGRVDRHPYGMILAAVGIGYVLGGGLFSRMTARLVRLGFRVAALPFVKEELLNLAKGAMAGSRDQASAPAEPPKVV